MFLLRFVIDISVVAVVNLIVAAIIVIVVVVAAGRAALMMSIVMAMAVTVIHKVVVHVEATAGAR